MTGSITMFAGISPMIFIRGVDATISVDDDRVHVNFFNGVSGD